MPESHVKHRNSRGRPLIHKFSPADGLFQTLRDFEFPFPFNRFITREKKTESLDADNTTIL